MLSEALGLEHGSFAQSFMIAGPGAVGGRRQGRCLVIRYAVAGQGRQATGRHAVIINVRRPQKER